MEGAFDYRNLLSQAMSAYDEKVSEAREKFEAKNAIVEGIKSSIERATDIPAGIFLTKPLEAGVKAIGTEKGRTALKEGVKKVSDIIKNKLQNKKVNEAGEQEPTELEDLNRPTPEAQQRIMDADPEDFDFGQARLTDVFADADNYLNSLSRGEETLQMIEAAGRTARRAAARVTQQLSDALPDLPGIQEAPMRDQLAPMREMMQRQQDNFNRQQNPRGQEQPEADAQENAQATTQSDSAGATDSTGAEGGISEGAEQATTDAVADAAGDAGAEAAGIGAAEVGLDALGPVGWLVGLFLGVSTLVGGIAGADSVKNPSVPKPPHMASVATQFGIGQ